MAPLLLMLAACGAAEDLSVARVAAHGDRVGGFTLAARTDADGSGALPDGATVQVWTRGADGDEWREADVVVGAAGDVAVQVSLVADNSGSEAGYLGEMQDAVADMGLRVLDRGTAGGDRVALTRVSTTSEIVLPLTDDADAWEGAVDDLYITNGWTALWDGVRLGHEALDDGVQLADGATGVEACLATTARTMVVFTDGQENNSADEHPTSYDGDGIDTTLSDLFDLAVLGVPTPVHTIGIGREVDEEALRELAEETGGAYRAIADHGDLHDALDGVVDAVEGELPVCFEPEYCSHSQALVEVTAGEETWSTVVELPGLCGCTRTRGYWSTHEEDWPVDALELGGREYSREAALEILGTSTAGDKSLQLASQLVASKLNVLSGADDTDIADVIVDADAWLAAHDDGDGLPFGTRAWGGGEELKDALDAFNNGDSGPGHCD